jgi:DNA-binding NarL/FixJ family response regulator
MLLETTTKTINLVLVDDHKIIRDGIKAFLKEDDINIVGEASNGRELLAMLEETKPDVVLLDINMPEMDGYEATKAIKEQHPDVKVLVLSMLDHEKYVQQMFDAGALGYTLKNIGQEELVHAIRMVADGQKFISTDVALAFLNKLRNILPASAWQHHEKRPTDLSAREIEVLKLIAEGMTNAEIADKLFTSKRTIESHRQNIIEKTQVKNTAALIKYALNNGLIV